MSTICAIATATGGAIGIVRISGPQAIDIASSIFRPHHGCPLTERAAATVTYGDILATDGEVFDDALATVFRAPHSYTGEDSVELSCHGSPYILQQVMHRLITAGCRTAEAGEYTKRAFLNGKMDLSQAEAVADLIASTTAANHRMAMRQMRGAFSDELHQLRDQLLHITTLLELELDFSDHEDLEFASRTELQTLAQAIHNRLTHLCRTFRLGNALKRGLPVAIVGETNAGKSTLLNALVGEERALVSDICGTTRDTIEETCVVGDTLIRFIDTAGLRQTDDTVERMGIARTIEKITAADLILWVIDATCAREQFDRLHAQVLRDDTPTLLLINKVDLLTPENQTALAEHFQAVAPTLPLHFLSAHRPADVEQVRRALADRLTSMQQALNADTDLIVSNARHHEALQLALAAIDRVSQGLATGLSGDFIAQDLRECIHHLSDIAGEVTTDAVLQNVFSHFCVGK